MKLGGGAALVAAAVGAAACVRVLGVDDVTYAAADAASDGGQGVDAPVDDGGRTEDTQIPICDGRSFHFACDGGAEELSHWSFDEGSGNMAYDCVGHVDGTLVSRDGGLMPQWIPGHRGQGLAFDGHSQRVRLGQPTALQLHNEVTLSAWVKPQMTGEGWVIIYEGNWGLGVFGGSPEAAVVQSGKQATLAIGTVPAGVWTHVAAVFRASTGLELYVDGALVKTLASPGETDNGNAASIGADEQYQKAYGGGIDEVRFFGRALSACDIAALAKE
jgi:hypothetical protein